MRAASLLTLLIAALSLALLGRPAAAQDWNPLNAFLGPEHKEERKPPPQEPAPQFLDEKSFAVERSELAPVMATDGSGLPFELWRGLDVATLEKLIAELDIPPRSPALHGLWLRLITSDVTPPTGGEQDQHFMALRLETLYRSGLLEDASRELAKLPAGNALVATLAARNEIGQGKKIEGVRHRAQRRAAGRQLSQAAQGAGCPHLRLLRDRSPAMRPAPASRQTWRASRV